TYAYDPTFSLPIDATKNVQNENAALKTKVAALQKNLKSATLAFEELQANGYEDTTERQDLIAEYLKLNYSVKEREEELYTVRKGGSAALDQKKNYIRISKLEVEKLTDATISAISKISERFDLSQFNLRQQFDIPSDYEDDL
ncbi:hypothetical protein E3Q06_01921, partial [Wallemia mellicola]